MSSRSRDAREASAASSCARASNGARDPAAKAVAGETSRALNAHLAPKDVYRVCILDDPGAKLIETAVRRLGLSARAYGKVLRVARTIADLAGADAIRSAHVAEAISWRVLDRDVGGHSHAA